MTSYPADCARLVVPDKIVDRIHFLEKFYLKPSEASFSNADNFRPEVASDVISGVNIDPTGVL